MKVYKNSISFVLALGIRNNVQLIKTQVVKSLNIACILLKAIHEYLYIFFTIIGEGLRTAVV